MPFFCIQSIVSLLRVMSTSHRSGIGPIFRHATHIVEELVLRVSAEVGIGDFFVGEVRHQRTQVVDAVVDASERAGGKSAVAAGFLFRRTFEYQNGNPVLGGGVCGTECSIAGADDYDVGGAGEFGARKVVTDEIGEGA